MTTRTKQEEDLNTLADQAQRKRVFNKVLLDENGNVFKSGTLRLTGAKKYWNLNPDTVYNLAYRLVGDKRAIEAFLRQHGLPENEIAETMKEDTITQGNSGNFTGAFEEEAREIKKIREKQPVKVPQVSLKDLRDIVEALELTPGTVGEAKATKAPAKATKAPAKATKAPAKATKAPAKATKAPVKGARSPRAKSPLQKLEAAYNQYEDTGKVLDVSGYPGNAAKMLFLPERTSKVGAFEDPAKLREFPVVSNSFTSFKAFVQELPEHYHGYIDQFAAIHGRDYEKAISRGAKGTKTPTKKTRTPTKKATKAPPVKAKGAQQPVKKVAEATQPAEVVEEEEEATQPVEQPTKAAQQPTTRRRLPLKQTAPGEAAVSPKPKTTLGAFLAKAQQPTKQVEGGPVQVTGTVNPTQPPPTKVLTPTKPGGLPKRPTVPLTQFTKVPTKTPSQ